MKWLNILDWVVKHQLMQTYEPGDGEFDTW